MGDAVCIKRQPAAHPARPWRWKSDQRIIRARLLPLATMSALPSSTVPAPRPFALPGGEVATLRPIAPDDLAIETAFVNGLSAETSYQRLFSTRRPGPEEIRRWTHVDQRCEVAWIAVVRREGADLMLGVARYVRVNCGEEAEFAIVLADAAQRSGLGRALLGILIEAARAAGIRALWGTTFTTNVGMLRLGRALGFHAGREPGDTMLARLRLPLD